MDTLSPAPQGSTDSVASQVTTQNAEPTTPLVEKPAGEPQAETPAGETEQKDAASGEDQSQEDKPKTGKEKRQERNRARWQEYKEAKAIMPARLESLERQVAHLKKTAPPDFSSIIDPNEEIAERAAWKVQQRTQESAEAQLEAERATSQADQARKLQAAWDEAKDDARERLPDFDQVVTDATPIHQRAAPFIVESEKGAEIAYWLGKNPKSAIELYEKFQTAPAQALIELGRIEARLSAPAPKTISTAPKPAATLSGGANPLAFDAKTAGVGDMQAQFRKLGLIS